MLKIQKTLLISFLAAAFILAGIGSYAKFAYWNNMVCCILVFIEFILAIAVLITAMWRPEME
nr:hypothetical protein [uncultured Draconibacterium sp.]